MCIQLVYHSHLTWAINLDCQLETVYCKNLCFLGDSLWLELLWTQFGDSTPECKGIRGRVLATSSWGEAPSMVPEKTFPQKEKKKEILNWKPGEDRATDEKWSSTADMGATSWRKQAGRIPVCGCRGGTDCTIRRFAYYKPPVPTFLLWIGWVVVWEGASYLANLQIQLSYCGSDGLFSKEEHHTFFLTFFKDAGNYSICWDWSLAMMMDLEHKHIHVGCWSGCGHSFIQGL